LPFTLRSHIIERKENKWGCAMSLPRFLMNLAVYSALLGTICVWTLLGRAAGL